MLADRAYSTFEIKSIDQEQRIIEGFASTPGLDRGGDLMDPAGAKFKLPQPLFYMHRHDEPIGEVFSAQPSAKGIYIKARIEQGTSLKYVEKAWSQIKHKLMRGLSIDWRALQPPEMKSGTRRYAAWEWLGTSVVSLPMNVDATILSIKSFDVEHSAALGTESSHPRTPPGVSGMRKDLPMTVSEQVTAAKTDLQAKSVRLEELITKKKDEGGLEAAEVTELGTLKLACKSLAEELDDLSTLEAAQATKAQTLTFGSPEARRVHRETPKIEMPPLPKGTGFTRYAMAVAAGKGSYSDTLEYAKRWQGQTPEVVDYVKMIHGKAVEGTTTLNSPAWGSQLVYAQNLTSEFIELLRPRTIMGRISGLRNVPFNVRMASQTDGSTVNWVGEGAVKPVSDLGFDTLSLGQHKIAGIVVLTEELVRSSQPSAEETVRRDLVEQIARFMDTQFIDPTVTATANRPASITNGVASPAAGGTTAEDLYFDMNAALATFDNADVSTESLVILMTPALARGISTLRNALGQFEFTGLTMSGGTLMGFPVIVSSSVPSGTIVIVAAGEILVADDGNVSLDASNQATLDMAGGASPTFSLWQRNCIGIRAERFVTWLKRRAASVAVIDTASYGPTAPS